jgi:putative N6-adenine-specific DNA methylase
MISFDSVSTITVTCHKRIAPYLEWEVRELGFIPQHTFITGLQLQGTLNDCIKLNLNLRCASQVLFSLQQFEAHHPDDIYRHLNQIAWEDIIPENGYFSVTSNVMHPTINNNLYANVRVKDAIVDRLREKTGLRPETGAVLRGTVIHLFWKNEHAEIFLDTSGESLGRHGYRKIPGRAPMLEALSAATILASKWDRRSPFINPMCGSGTLAIEAALIATNRRPGLFRANYAFMHLKGYNEEVYLDAFQQLDDQIIEVPGLQIVASDHSKVAVENTRKNAAVAEVASLITYEVCDFRNTTIPEGNGVVMLNPEYGDRLGDIESLIDTYALIGDFLKKQCTGYTGYIFTGNMELAKKIGLKPSRRMEFYNATIDCRLLEYELYRGSKRVEKPNP